MQTAATKFPLIGQLQPGLWVNEGQEQLQSTTKLGLKLLNSSVPPDM